jgi:CoA:oxalate CoA-transferase
MIMQLLEGTVVLDFSQFLSGPSSGLRLADLGAMVIKIERPGMGDICRELYVSDVVVEGESTIFHAINRNKLSYAADLKNADDLEKIKKLIVQADVMIHNFRPGVMERLGLSYEVVRQINPSIIYAEISGYGSEGPWSGLPGQDLLLQSVSGLTWLTNNENSGPTPMGVAVVDILAGTHLTQGILAALLQRAIHHEGAIVQVSMMESILDFQFEVLTSFYNDGNELPVRSRINNGHAYIAAPYGIYQTANGYIALAMGSIPQLGSLLGCIPLEAFTEPALWFERRDEIKTILADWLLNQPTEYWLNILQPADIWCARVMNYAELREEEGYKVLEMEMETVTSNGLKLKTTRCPIRVDGEITRSSRGAPRVGEHNMEIDRQFGIVA